MYVIDRYIFYNVHESEVCKCQTFDTGAWYLIQSGVKMNFVLTSYPEVNSYPEVTSYPQVTSDLVTHR